VFVLIIVRLLGKRTVGNFTPFDLIVAFIISEVVDEPIYGDVPMIQGLLVIAVVACLHYLNSLLSYRFPAFERLTSGVPKPLIKNGRGNDQALASERISDSELQSMLRERAVDNLGDVKLAMLETSGMLSVIKTEEAREAEKRDLKNAGDRSR
jgi:uncharacterized membrane protein YcaP (DUF421 family)